MVCCRRAYWLTASKRTNTRILANFLLVAAVSAAPFNALAATDAERIADLEEQLKQSVSTIEQLSARVSDIEDHKTPIPASANKTNADRLDIAEQQIAQIQLEPPKSTIFDSFHGFANVGAAYSNDDGDNGFTLGSVDLYFSPRLSDHVKALIEIVFEYDDTGELFVDLERLQVGYTLSSGQTLWLGRFHTPLGTWNTGFHHGLQLQTSILRPSFIEFEDEGGLLPAHMVGLWGSGSIRKATGRFSYDLFAGNSPSIKDGALDANNTGSHPTELSVGFNVGYQFDNVGDGIKIGLHGLRADIRDDTSTDNLSRFNMLGGYALVDTAKWEMIAEYYGFRNQNTQGMHSRQDSWAGFIQLGKRLDDWTVYGRVERSSLSDNDAYFQTLDAMNSYDRQALGLRYDITINSALKLEIIHTDPKDTTDKKFNKVMMQWAFRF
jgi:hypothetical protein